MAIRIIPARRVRKVKTPNGQEVLRRLEEYLESECDDPIEILCGFWKDQQDAITYQELRQAVLDGALTAETLELWRQDYSILVADRLSNIWTKAIEAGPKGQPILDGLAFEFNTQTPGIFDWLKERGANFITVCTQEQQDAIAALLAQKMREGHTVDELARMIRPCIGLTEGDTKAAARLYDSIVANLKKEHPRMKAESIRKKALDATQKYAERKHRARAMMIAQTESAFAYNRGADEGIRQAQAEGYLGITKKRWSTSGDNAVCDVCASLEGVEIDMDDEFGFKGKVLFKGHKLLPPAHPRCACAVEYIEVSKPDFTILPAQQQERMDYMFIPEENDEETLEIKKDFTELYKELPWRAQFALQGTRISVGNPSIMTCGYDRENDILYFTKDYDKGRAYHEIGHVVAGKITDNRKIQEALERATAGVTFSDITKSTFLDDAGNSVQCIIAKSDSFVSLYQGRVYVDYITDAYDFSINQLKYEYMLEYFSEGFREYFENPVNLAAKDSGLYALIKEVLYDY